MSIKDILVYADAEKSATSRFRLAIGLAETYGAHLTAVHVSTPAFIPVDPVGGIPVELIEWQEQIQREQADATRKLVESFRQSSGLAIEYRAERGDLVDTVLDQSRYADLIVVSQADGQPPRFAEASSLPEELALGAGRPVLVIPSVGEFSVTGRNILVAWNRTREATRTLHDALPILQKAKKVTIMEVNPETSDQPHIPGADIAAHLARHGVKADAASTVAKDIDVGDVILSRAADLGSDLIVMGAYGHSRLRETILGGATRHILAHMTAPVLLSH